MATDFQDESIAKARDIKERLERDDYNNAIAGRETGRMRRFGTKSKDEVEAERRKAERVFRDALGRALEDPEYRALYDQLGERLADAESTADQILADIQTAIRKLDDKIAGIEARAARGPDGRLVFRTACGRVVTADGEEIPPEIAAGIIWPPNAPSAEVYFGAKDQRSDLAVSLEEWRAYRNDSLGGIRDRYEDHENPQSIEGLQEDLEKIERDAPSVPPSLNSMSRTASVPAPSAAVIPTLPDL